MIARLVFAASLAALSCTTMAAADIQLFTGSGPGTYRKVLLAPPQVEFDPRFVAEGDLRGAHPSRRRDDDAKLAESLGRGFLDALAGAFRRHGFEVVSSPASDVLTMNPAIKDLRVNVPGDAATREFYVRAAGEATMVITGSNASGAPIMRATGRGIAGETAAFHPASRISHRAEFDAMFREWADEVARSLAGRK